MQSKSVGIEQLVPVISEAVQNGSAVNITPRGRSMLPFLSERDSVTLTKAPGKLKKYDIALYFRRRTGLYVMHRVIGFTENGYIFCGDNQGYPEMGVEYGDIVALVCRADRNGRQLMRGAGYALYCRTLIFRRFFIRTKLRLERLMKL